MRMKLEQVHLRGYKSVGGGDGQTIRFGDVTVLLGANGSGKSNLMSFFRMLNFMMTDALQLYVGKQGASRLLFYGPKQTEFLSFRLEFGSEEARNTYEAKLSYGLPDNLFISGEKISYLRHDHPSGQPQEYYLNAGGRELGLAADGRSTSKVLYGLLSRIHTYHFEDTSDTAKIKDRVYVDDAKYLRSDAGNLAAFLRMMKECDGYRKYYDRIVRHIQSVMPQFGDFDLEAVDGNKDYIRLNWTDISGNDYPFDPHHLSDGSLRFMALATLLLQPPDLLPNFIVLDEPELGLHPAAIAELGGIIHSVSHKVQILLATQSTRLVDEFSLDNLVIVERDNEKHCSVFKRLDHDRLKNWLEQYSLSELWEKNVLGGKP